MKNRLVFCLLLACALPVAAEKFTLSFQPAQNPALKVWETRYRGDALLAKGLEQLNAQVTVPRPLPVIFAQTGVVNAWYSPSQHRLTFSYELAAELEKIFAAHPQHAPQAAQLAQQASRFILYHEQGHALIDELDLPQTGKNEDAADELAVLLATRLPGGQEGARAAALWFQLSGAKYDDASKVAPLFWDEHSLDLQRYYIILANLEAALPGSVPGIAKLMPADRLARARQRWPGKVASWGMHFGTSWPGLAKGAYPSVPAGGGRIQVIWEPAVSPEGQAVRGQLEGKPELQAIATIISDIYRLPRDLRLSFVDDPNIGCRYQSELGRVALSYQYVLSLIKDLARFYQDPKEMARHCFSTLTVELLIRLQQMALHEMRVPITGDEEDAAVEATLNFMDNYPSTRKTLFEASEYWRLKSTGDNAMRTYAYWDEDDLHYQRLMDIYMHLQQGDPKTYAWVTRLIDKRRLFRYSSEWRQKTRSWQRILTPYVRI